MRVSVLNAGAAYFSWGVKLVHHEAIAFIDYHAAEAQAPFPLYEPKLKDDVRTRRQDSFAMSPDEC